MIAAAPTFALALLLPLAAGLGAWAAARRAAPRAAANDNWRLRPIAPATAVVLPFPKPAEPTPVLPGRGADAMGGGAAGV